MPACAPPKPSETPPNERKAKYLVCWSYIYHPIGALRIYVYVSQRSIHLEDIALKGPSHQSDWSRNDMVE
jgi:hypothetical protein